MSNTASSENDWCVFDLSDRLSESGSSQLLTERQHVLDPVDREVPICCYFGIATLVLFVPTLILLLCLVWR